VDGARKPPLTNLEYQLLLCLYDNTDCICDKYDIVENVWGGSYIEDVDDSRIAKLVSRLREAVEPNPANPRYIITVHGRGYKLVSFADQESSR
jgi:two-component system response regulator RegX3